MKITHVALTGPVTDGFSYQENLLPKYHKRLGFEVSIISSKFKWNKFGNIDIDPRNVYINEDGIKVVRIESSFFTNVTSKFKKYKNLFNTLKVEKPEIIFVHGLQFLDMINVIRYVKKNPHVKLFIDNHADFSNSATNWISREILHKIIWKHMAQFVEPYTEKFYGVLPARVDFLVDVYKLSKNRVELLVMGADDDEVIAAQGNTIRAAIRDKHQVKDSDFLLVTGGKIDSSKKQTILLMRVVKELVQSNNNLKLIVFGSVAEELQKEVHSLVDNKSIQYIDWLTTSEAYQYFAASDLVVFPGRHSVYWEQAVGQGKPLLVKLWKGTTHIDLGGNVEFFKSDNESEIKAKLVSIINDKLKYNKMCEIALKENNHFLYSEIAKRSIQNIKS